MGENINILSYNDFGFISKYAIPAVQWACGEGIIGGYTDGTLKPNAIATRAHTVEILMSTMMCSASKE